MARLQRPLQHILQRFAGIHRGQSGEGAGQQGQLHRVDSPVHRRQQAEPRPGQGQLRPRHREVGESHQATQHQDAPTMDKKPTEDTEGHRVAEPPRVQPLHLEGLAADGQVAVPERRVRRGCSHLQLYVAPVPYPARHQRTGKGLAGQELYGVGLAVRCRGRHQQAASRHHALPRRQGLGLHLCRLLHTQPALRGGPTLSAQSHQTREAAQAESPRVVPLRTVAGPAGTQGRSLRRLQAYHPSEPSLRTGVQCPHCPDGGDGPRGQECPSDGEAAEAHGCIGQQQRLSGPGVLCHRQHLAGRT